MSAHCDKTYTHTHVQFKYAYKHGYTHIRVYTYTCAHTQTLLCIHTHTHTHTHLCTHTNTPMKLYPLVNLFPGSYTHFTTLLESLVRFLMWFHYPWRDHSKDLPFAGDIVSALSLGYKRAPKSSYKKCRFTAFLCCLRTTAVLAHAKIDLSYLHVNVPGPQLVKVKHASGHGNIQYHDLNPWERFGVRLGAGHGIVSRNTTEM